MGKGKVTIKTKPIKVKTRPIKVKTRPVVVKYDNRYKRRKSRVGTIIGIILAVLFSYVLFRYLTRKNKSEKGFKWLL